MVCFYHKKIGLHIHLCKSYVIIPFCLESFLCFSVVLEPQLLLLTGEVEIDGLKYASFLPLSTSCSCWVIMSSLPRADLLELEELTFVGWFEAAARTSPLKLLLWVANDFSHFLCLLNGLKSEVFSIVPSLLPLFFTLGTWEKSLLARTL